MSGREAFEAWARGRGARDIDFEIRPDGHYAASYIDATWHAWKARDAEAAEKDARIAKLEDQVERLHQALMDVQGGRCDE